MNISVLAFVGILSLLTITILFARDALKRYRWESIEAEDARELGKFMGLVNGFVVLLFGALAALTPLSLAVSIVSIAVCVVFSVVSILWLVDKQRVVDRCEAIRADNLQ
jgi:hypothetical protein